MSTETPVIIETSDAATGRVEESTTLPQLGLVCITFADTVRYRALTRKRLLQFSPEMQASTLRELYADNLTRFRVAIDFCRREGIKLYRLTSALFPFADTEAGADVLAEMSDAVRRAGEESMARGVRVVLHPDQFCVLSSDSPHVIENSILILSTHAMIFDMLGLPQSMWAAMNIHGGKADRADRLVSVIRDLPEPVRSRICFENDEHAYSADQILEVCRRAEVPMCFDAHHHICQTSYSSYEHESVPRLLDAARETWGDHPEWQLTHISNGLEYFQDPKHSHLIDVMPSSFARAGWIEVEAKGKEEAIQKLQREWLPQLDART